MFWLTELQTGALHILYRTMIILVSTKGKLTVMGTRKKGIYLNLVNTLGLDSIQDNGQTVDAI